MACSTTRLLSLNSRAVGWTRSLKRLNATLADRAARPDDRPPAYHRPYADRLCARHALGACRHAARHGVRKDTLCQPNRPLQGSLHREGRDDGRGRDDHSSRFEGKAMRQLMESEVLKWSMAEVSSGPINVLDLRTTGSLLLGISTDITSAKLRMRARQFSQMLYDETDLDGIFYRSRLTGEDCLAVYDRGVAKLTAGPVVDLLTIADLIPGLKRLISSSSSPRQEHERTWILRLRSGQGPAVRQEIRSLRGPSRREPSWASPAALRSASRGSRHRTRRR